MEKSEKVENIAKSLKLFQSTLKAVKMDATNPFFKSNYATLESCWDTIRKPLAENGLSILQMPESENGHINITTMLLHESGEWIKCTYGITPKDNNPQTIGSAITYLRRYGLGMLGIVTDTDDDANSAQSNPKDKSPTPSRDLRKEEPVKDKPQATKFKDTDVLSEEHVKALLAHCTMQHSAKGYTPWKSVEEMYAFLEQSELMKSDDFITVGIAKKLRRHCDELPIRKGDK